MNVRVLPTGPIATNAYLLTAPDMGEAVIIDAHEGIWLEIKDFLAEDKCVLKEVWLTHAHWDHIQGVPELVRQTGATVRAHPADRVLLETPAIQSPFAMEGMTLEAIRVDRWFDVGERLKAVGREFEVRHVPGHCPGNVLFYSPRDKVAFVGDTLFAGAIGRTDLPGGDHDELMRSIREQILTLPDETLIGSGHGPATTVGDEKATNPYVLLPR